MSGYSHEEQFALNAAEGWLLLGSPADAESELKTLEREHLDRPEALCLRWAIQFRLKRWADAERIARQWCSVAPDALEPRIALANSTRECYGLEEAKNVLLQIIDRFPREWVVPYNLACYSAQLGQIAEAVLWLDKALRLDTQQRVETGAADDPDLAPLWEVLSGADRAEDCCAHGSEANQD